MAMCDLKGKCGPFRAMGQAVMVGHVLHMNGAQVVNSVVFKIHPKTYIYAFYQNCDPAVKTEGTGQSAMRQFLLVKAVKIICLHS